MFLFSHSNSISWVLLFSGKCSTSLLGLTTLVHVTAEEGKDCHRTHLACAAKLLIILIIIIITITVVTIIIVIIIVVIM